MDIAKEKAAIQKRHREILSQLERLPEKQVVLELETKLAEAKQALTDKQGPLLEEILILGYRFRALGRLERGEDTSINPLNSVELIRDPPGLLLQRQLEASCCCVTRFTPIPPRGF